MGRNARTSRKKVERGERMNKYLAWEYAKNPNDFNEMGIDIDRIISITYNSNHGCYVMFYWEYKN